MSGIQEVEVNINVAERTHSPQGERKIEILQDFLSIIPDDEIDIFFKLIIEQGAELGYRFKGTADELLETLNV